MTSMEKKYLFLTAFFISSLFNLNYSFSQRTCGYDSYLSQQFQTNPKFEIKRQLIEQQLQEWIQNQPKNDISKKVIVTIPVVVHIVYNNNSQNISDAQIQSQISVLNEDYRRTNTDASNTPTSFQTVAADCEIEFCLAQQDPNGVATNGITRTSTSTTSFFNDNVKSTSAGGKDGWPRNDYLNIWVCNLSGGLLGYATPPGGSATTDGVVIGYNYFGTVGTLSPPFNKGRTTTHEIGHWLDLFHTFDGGCAGTSQSNCATSGDRICDTPPTSSPNYGCPSNTQNSCTETPTDQNDMHMNFMDYVDDNCMNLFTLDQKSRMVGTLNGVRSTLLSSQGCANTSSNNLDASISGIISPTGAGCSSTITPIVTLINLGLNTLTSITINYNIDGGPNSTFLWTGSLTTSNNEDVTLPNIVVLSGTHIFNSSTSNPNGGTDQNLTNDANSQSFTINGAGSGSQLPFFEGFEDNTFPPVGWTLDNPESNATWSRDTSTSGFGGSTACAQMYFFSPTEDITGQSDYLYTLELDFSTATSPTVMEWNLAYAQWGSSNYDSLIIWASIDCGSTWNRVWQKGGTQLATAPDNTNSFVPSDTEWINESINLSNFIGNSSVQIQFQAFSQWGNNLFIDDINIHTPTDLSPIIINNSEIRIFPNPTNGILNFEYNGKKERKLNMTIFNSVGELITERKINFEKGKSYTLDISENARGIYFIRIVEDKATIMSRKISLIR